MQQARDEYLLLIAQPGAGERQPCEDLFSLEALLRTDWDYAATYERSMRLARDDRATGAVRTGAAGLAMVLADNLCDIEKSVEAYSAHTQVIRDGPDSLADAQAELIYRTAIGELDLAKEAANRLVEHARAANSPPELARVLHYAATAYRFCGDFEKVRSLLRESEAIARRHGLDQARRAALMMLASTTLDRGDFGEAAKLLDQADLVGAAPDDQRAVSDIVVLRVRLLLAAGRVTEAQARWHARPPLLMQPIGLRARTDNLAVAVVLALDGSDPIKLRSSLNELAESMARSVTGGFQDYAVAARCRAMQRLGETAAARVLATAYIERDRREIGPPSHDLAAALSMGAVPID